METMGPAICRQLVTGHGHGWCGSVLPKSMPSARRSREPPASRSPASGGRPGQPLKRGPDRGLLPLGADGKSRRGERSLRAEENADAGETRRGGIPPRQPALAAPCSPRWASAVSDGAVRPFCPCCHQQRWHQKRQPPPLPLCLLILRPALGNASSHPN